MSLRMICLVPGRTIIISGFELQNRTEFYFDLYKVHRQLQYNKQKYYKSTKINASLYKLKNCEQRKYFSGSKRSLISNTCKGCRHMSLAVVLELYIIGKNIKMDSAALYGQLFILDYGPINWL